jgi:hypothetical protein
MAHLIPVAEHFAAYHIETDHGTELVPVDVAGPLTKQGYLPVRIARHLDGEEIYTWTLKEGWYGRLSAPGYLDCTEWLGPFDSADAALDAVQESFDVDEDGNDVDDEPPPGEAEREARGEYLSELEEERRG